MQLIALGLNHTTAPVEVRQRVSFGDAEIPATIGYLRERFSSPRQGGVTTDWRSTRCLRPRRGSAS